MSERPVTTRALSRIHGPRRVLRELQRVLIKTARALEHRQLGEDDRRWCARVIDRLTPLIDEGLGVLSGLPDPRERRRARKRPLRQPPLW